MFNLTINHIGKHLLFPKPYITRSFIQWLNIVFNQVDQERRKLVGPDRVCTEWLLRNGAFVKWVGIDKFVKDYNTLPPENTRFYVEKIDATGSSISHYGFLHLMGCKYVNEIILSDCSYIENEAIKQLKFVKDTLEHLNVSKCGNITAAGIFHIKELSKLKTLELFHLQFVEDKPKVLAELKKNLPNCQITSDF